MMRALQRPGTGDHGRRNRCAIGERADRLGGDAGDRRCPIRVFLDAIVETKQVATELFKSGAITRDELRIVALLRQQEVRHREHERGIGVGPDRNPLCAKKIRRVGLERTYRDKLDAGVFPPSQPGLQAVHSGSARCDLGILERKAAERDHKPGVLDDG